MIVQTYTKPITSEQEDAISAFLSSQPYDTVFQSPAYYALYLSIRNFKPYYFLLYDDNNVLSGVMLAVIIREANGIFSVLSSRCVVYGGPVVSNDNPEFMSEILSSLNKKISRLTVLTQFRNFRIWNETSVKIFKNNGFTLRDHLDLIVDNSDPEMTLMGMSSSRRRQLKKGLHSGSVVRPAESLAEVKDLYHILYSLYREKIRKPLPRWPYFEQFYSQLVPAGKGVILLVISEGKIIGGIVSPVTPGKIMYELYICGLDREYPHHYPSILATWAALEWGTKNNIPSFDFLGMGKPGIPYGVRDFKLRFGGEQVNFGRFGRHNYRLIYSIAELGYNVLRGMRRV